MCLGDDEGDVWKLKGCLALINGEGSTLTVYSLFFNMLWFLLCLLPHLSLFPRRLIIVNVGATTIRYVGFRACFFLN
jgi:hypothetical protein